ncbi:MAG: fibronectin type III domain-containing protein, partial [Planctomycetia bacterium]|nr:fibronectin type III domain-containing protein [Planctomycetia bacterium]
IVRPVSTLTSYVATGLTNGTAYVFKVIAVNAVGISLPSATSSPVTPVSVPSAAVLLSVVAGNTTATLTWTAPVSNGGSPITDYIVKRSTNGGTTWTRIVRPVSTLTSYVATGLTNGTAYVFKVIAVNAVGISLPSATSSPVTPTLPA